MSLALRCLLAILIVLAAIWLVIRLAVGLHCGLAKAFGSDMDVACACLDSSDPQHPDDCPDE